MRAILGISLLIIAIPASAEWVKYSENTDYHQYYDNSSIRKVEKLHRVWIVQNVKNPKFDWKSQRYLLEIDCNEARDRTLETTQHSEFMAKGRTVFTLDNPPLDWRYIPPDSPSEALLKIVCRNSR